MKKRIFFVFVRNSIKEICDFERETCYALARRDFVLAFFINEPVTLKELIWGKKILKKVKQNLYYLHPLLMLPSAIFPFITSINFAVNALVVAFVLLFYKVRKKLGGMYVWMFHPRDYDVWKYIRFFFYSIYDVVDYFGAKELRDSGQMREKEQQLLTKSQKVTAISHKVFAYVKCHRKDVVLVSQGFRIKTFQKKYVRKYPKEIKRLMSNGKRRPVVGFVGGLNHRIDYALLYDLARRCPDCNFVIVGPLQYKQDNNFLFIQRSTETWISLLSRLPNVFLSKKAIDQKYVPHLLDLFDICMIPYDMSQEFNAYCYPMKVFEYFYAGKPVISTPIDELRKFPIYIQFGSNANAWEQRIRKTLSTFWPVRYQRQQRKLAEVNSWEGKVKAITAELL